MQEPVLICKMFINGALFRLFLLTMEIHSFKVLKSDPKKGKKDWRF
jgi:hypothetical protein